MTPSRKNEPTPIEVAREARRLAQLRRAALIRDPRDAPATDDPVGEETDDDAGDAA